MNYLLKATSKGQITLPAKWRKNFKTDRYLVREKAGKLEISPIDLDDLEDESGWTTVFNAARDNRGKGVDARDLLQALREIK